MQNHYAPPRATVADVPKAGRGITDIMLVQLQATRPWALLVAVVLIIVAVFMLLATAGMIMAGLVMSLGAEGVTAVPMTVFLVAGAVYGVGAITYLLMGIYLAKYSSAISTAVATGHAQDVTHALDQQRKFWKVAGIVTLVTMILTLVWIGMVITLPEIMAEFQGMH